MTIGVGDKEFVSTMKLYDADRVLMFAYSSLTLALAVTVWLPSDKFSNLIVAV